MNFLWPSMLYLLLFVPVITLAYLVILRRRRRVAVRYSSLSLIRVARPRGSWLRRHLPFILFLISLAGLLTALARPTATVSVPSNRSTIILAMDVSRSMCSTDIPPNRLEAAKRAALSFVQNQQHGKLIGIVAFAGFAELIQPPTDNLDLLQNAIVNLTVARRTAIGSAILRAIDAIAEIDSSVAPADTGSLADSVQQPAEKFGPHIIVLLTDGSSNAGPNPLNAATQAAARGVRVYTIGFGTLNNTSSMDCGDGFFGDEQFFSGGFGPQFGGGGVGGFSREIDEGTLNAIANTTGGQYYVATSASELEQVFRSLPSYLVIVREPVEISAFFSAFAALMAVTAVFLSIRWNPLG